MRNTKYLIIFIISVFYYLYDYNFLKYEFITDGLWHKHFANLNSPHDKKIVHDCLNTTQDSLARSNVLERLKIKLPLSLSEIIDSQSVDMCLRRLNVKTFAADIKKQYFNRRNILLGNENNFIFNNQLYLKKRNLSESSGVLQYLKEIYKNTELQSRTNLNIKIFCKDFYSLSIEDVIYICDYINYNLSTDCFHYKNVDALKKMTYPLLQCGN